MYTFIKLTLKKSSIFSGIWMRIWMAIRALYIVLRESEPSIQNAVLVNSNLPIQAKNNKYDRLHEPIYQQEV